MMTSSEVRRNTCVLCGAELFLDSCQDCARRAANEPEFAETPHGQWALAANARVCRIARQAAQRPEWVRRAEVGQLPGKVLG